jgi:hypothetical protein
VSRLAQVAHYAPQEYEQMAGVPPQGDGDVDHSRDIGERLAKLRQGGIDRIWLCHGDEVLILAGSSSLLPQGWSRRAEHVHVCQGWRARLGSSPIMPHLLSSPPL